jgi:hypothetical protein
MLAVDLLNAPDHEAATVSAILRRNSVTKPDIDAGQVAELSVWIGRIRPLFGEPDVDRQIALVNELLTDAATGVQVSRHDGSDPHLHYITQTVGTVPRVRATTAGGLAIAICGAGGHRLGRCGRTGCGAAYVDTSRNGRRRFCSVACANRVNVAAHRARAR